MSTSNSGRVPNVLTLVIGFALWDRMERLLTTWYLYHASFLFYKTVVDKHQDRFPWNPSCGEQLVDVCERHRSQCFYDRRAWFVLFLCHIHLSELSLIYAVAVAVPGELRGWEHLHRKHSKLPWAKLFEGAIKLARYGFTVNEDLATALNDGRNTGFLRLHGMN